MRRLQAVIVSDVSKSPAVNLWEATVNGAAFDQVDHAAQKCISYGEKSSITGNTDRSPPKLQPGHIYHVFLNVRRENAADPTSGYEAEFYLKPGAAPQQVGFVADWQHQQTIGSPTHGRWMNGQQRQFALRRPILGIMREHRDSGCVGALMPLLDRRQHAHRRDRRRRVPKRQILRDVTATQQRAQCRRRHVQRHARKAPMARKRTSTGRCSNGCAPAFSAHTKAVSSTSGRVRTSRSQRWRLCRASCSVIVSTVGGSSESPRIS
jgi:hypothetical protein